MGADWASYNLGIFLCESCGSIHRSLGSHISKVKSLKLDKWDESQIQVMANFGNERVKQKYEQNVPPAYRRPKPSDPLVIREQWIRAKYERQEFVEGSKPTYLSGRKEGYMWKRGKDDKHFQRRRFILDASENTLRYYNKESGGDAKACLRLDGLNVTIVPEKVGNPNAMQIMFERDSQIRSLFVYTETPQDVIDWYTAIRVAKLNRLAIAFPSTQTDELVSMITRDFLREGWLYKTGPRSGDAFRRRWFTLDNRRLMYFEDPMNPFPKGEVFIGSTDRGFSIVEGISPGIKDPGYGFTLRTPERHYQFSAETDGERREWMDVIQYVLSCPLSPQDTRILYRSTSI
jgi:hypothetical protein